MKLWTGEKKGRKGLCPRSRRRKKTQKEKENEIVNEETVNGRQDVRDRREQAVNLWNHHVIARSGHKKPKSDHMETNPGCEDRSMKR